MTDLLLSDGAQFDRFHELAFNRDGERELRVRAMAKSAIQDDRAYEPSGVCYPYLNLPSYRLFELEPEAQIQYHMIRVRLCPSLRGAPEILLIAEEIIRQQMKELND